MFGFRLRAGVVIAGRNDACLVCTGGVVSVGTCTEFKSLGVQWFGLE